MIDRYLMSLSADQLESAIAASWFFIIVAALFMIGMAVVWYLEDHHDSGEYLEDEFADNLYHDI